MSAELPAGVVIERLRCIARDLESGALLHEGGLFAGELIQEGISHQLFQDPRFGEFSRVFELVAQGQHPHPPELEELFPRPHLAFVDAAEYLIKSNGAKVPQGRTRGPGLCQYVADQLEEVHSKAQSATKRPPKVKASARAISLVTTDSTWLEKPDAAIAEAVGCHPSTLSRDEAWQRLREAHKQQGRSRASEAVVRKTGIAKNVVRNVDATLRNAMQDSSLDAD